MKSWLTHHAIASFFFLAYAMWALGETLGRVGRNRPRPRTLVWSVVGFAPPLLLFGAAHSGRAIRAAA
jgi:hypothetical protein